MRAARALTTTIGVRRAATARAAASRTTRARSCSTGSCACTTGPGTTTRAAAGSTAAAATALGHHLARAERQHCEHGHRCRRLPHHHRRSYNCSDC
ncbi:hypothetical protein [Rhodopseudomonas palustris]|uniref:hypothetical protein n=1 Tax=Rhodopseudomonas palustris TaxID=1076 RepID=UPI0021F24FE0|nr:hypothetical protein [Rhodopseudomonas palustris]UYO55923.1 hypothetical protein KQX61_11185 [Rhodopseudomonas palustris]